MIIDPTIRIQAREFLEYEELKEGYWTFDKFMEQVRMAVKIAEMKYPQSEGYKHVWICLTIVVAIVQRQMIH